MSGGYFNYVQHRMDDAAEEMRRLAEESDYPDDIKQSFMESAKTMEEAAFRFNQADLLVSGDNGEDSYREAMQEIKRTATQA